VDQVVTEPETPLPTGSALLAAAGAGRAETVRALLAAGADPNVRAPGTGLTALMVAAGRGHDGIVTLLVAAGADVLTADPGGGATALHKACQGGSLAAVKALVEAGAFVDAVAPTTGHTPLMDALWFKHPDVVKYLLDRQAGIGLATHYGFTMAEHVAYELRVNAIGGDRLRAADEHLAARRRADAERAAGQQLMAAVGAGDVTEVRRLLGEGAAVDERAPIRNGFDDGHTPLLVAARDGHAQIAALLLAAGADVNAIEPTFGAVPLHKTVYNGHVELTWLIAAQPGVRLDAQGATNGYTPLHDALWHGYEDCAQILVDSGARLDLAGHDGKTALDLAAEVFGAAHPLTRQIRTAPHNR
jgi:ankyrin repeat protein